MPRPNTVNTASDGSEERLAELLSDFSLESAVKWLRKKFASFDTSMQSPLPLGDSRNDQAYFAGIRRLGYVSQLRQDNKTDVNRPLAVIAVRMKKDLSERTSRSVQFHCAKRLLKEEVEHGQHNLTGMPSQGIFFFYDDSGHFRISLVTGEVENRRFKFNEAKRQSFFVDPEAQNNIVKRRLNVALSSYADLKEAFSVEKLTKEFYNSLFKWYEWAMDPGIGVTFPNDTSRDDDDRKQLSEAMIRLITRLMFVWFIRQRGIVPCELFQQNELKKIIRDFKPASMEQDNYYRIILQNLFFATLNCQPDKRKFVSIYRGMSKEQGVKTCYRYADELFSVDEFQKLMKPVPFLNCALFDCLDKTERPQDGGREILLDGFSSKRGKQAHVPNGLFFDEAKGLIKLFSLYEFTVDENAADDSDVALDPELLGKVFENLLGAFNPETQETARKATGSFYTPREIVDYMVEESLRNYLKSKVPGIDDERLDDLFDKARATEGAPTKFNLDETDLLLNALYDCKILDPACGSGAFPMGVLHCMVRLLGRLDPHNVRQREIILKRHKEESTDGFTGLSESERREWEANLQKQLEEERLYPDYARKLYLIENCIYGVDIQPIATQISKLRFFISLLCDQLRSNLDPDAENYGLLSLPNLEAKFVCANTLLALPKVDGGGLALSAEGIQELKEALQKNRHKIFFARTAETKAKYKEQDLNLRDQIKETVRGKLYTPDEKIIAVYEKELENALKEREAVAEPKIELEEQIVGGDLFTEGEKQWVEVDVNAMPRKRIDERIKNARRIIAEERNKANLKPTGSTDIEKLAAMVAGWDPYDQNACSDFFDPEWMFNVKNGFDIVIGNPPYISAPAMVKVCPEQRKKIIESGRYKTLYQKWDIYIPFIELGIRYLASQDGFCTMIVPYPLTNQTYGLEMRKMLVTDYNIVELVDLNGTKIFDVATVSNCIPFIQNAPSSEKTIISKITENRSIYKSFVTSSLVQDENTYVWNVSGEERNTQRHSDMHVLGDFCYISKGMVLNSDEKDNQGAFTKEDLISEKQDKTHPRKYIEAKDIEKYAVRRIRFLEYDTPRCPKMLSRPTFRELYEKPKIVLNCLGSINATIDISNQFLHNHSIYCAVLWRDLKIVFNKSISVSVQKFSVLDRAEMEALSKTVDLKYLLGIMNSRYVSVLLTLQRGGDYHIYPEHIRNIPIPSATAEQQNQVIEIVDKILYAKEKNPNADISAWENELDKLVYVLYGLSDEEIAAVEQAPKMDSEPLEKEKPSKGRKKASSRKPRKLSKEDEYLD